MPHYFKLRRRKFGLVTLLVACLLATVWILNLRGYPEALPRLFRIEFADTGVRIKASCVHAARSPTRAVGNATIISGAPISATQLFDILLPYWSIVVPPTLLSAWLLLSKPKQPKPTTEPPV